ncbi:protein O-mannosyl-transferase 2 isoform X2 [Phlebotomus papatasi]|uniref:protein O-mannosyl-transferase 2 isoform X2 n=1 Tax=Phlebotomus papatasi TaxID=29031 RepID=UPI002483A90D|nr:protein O-mannosyl-transferase 2 isoform X2 [Phlebotomus papatasi]
MTCGEISGEESASILSVFRRKLAKKTVKMKKNPPELSGKEKQVSRWTVFAIIVLLTVLTRFYKVTEPDHVCWDETHFGKMGSWYINRTFFFDVHPPLGKMLIALSGKLTGYNGTYPFEKPGDKYNGTRYEGMRIFCTTLGALIVPMSFDIVHDLTRSVQASLMASAYILLDVGMITLNQYILLDPILMFFMTASVLGMVKVTKNTEEDRSFSGIWWFWLLFTGLMLACTISVKFVGLFVVLLVGLHTISDLWNVLGNLSKPVIFTVKQLIARAIALIAWPALVYMFFFYIHLEILNRSGNGDGFYSSAFQSKLIGNSLYNASMPRYVAYGAVVTIKNHKTGGGYLHSHFHLYPKGAGARQQQITTYTHKDENNKWRVKYYNKDVNPDDEVDILRNGQLVRLEHVPTRRNLHSHPEQAPLTKKHYQVTGYGENGTGDANDVWKVIIVGGRENERVETVTTSLLFIHYLQNCALTTSGKQLPKWGFEQQEVTCNPNLRDSSAQWNVEDNEFDRLPKVNFEVYAPGFLSRFFESHAVMIQGNAGLKPKEGEVTSQPWQWPINYRGQFFSGSAYRIYLLGNPIIWWSNLVFIAIFLVLFIISAIRHERGYEDFTNPDSESKWRSLRAGAWLFGGWLLHYLPFWAMGRVLYFHHYFPALIFNSMLTGVVFNYLTHRLPIWLRQTVLGASLGVLGWSFVKFSPLAYGMMGPSAGEANSTMNGLKWMESWEF